MHEWGSSDRDKPRIESTIDSYSPKKARPVGLNVEGAIDVERNTEGAIEGTAEGRYDPEVQVGRCDQRVYMKEGVTLAIKREGTSDMKSEGNYDQREGVRKVQPYSRGR